MVVPAWPRACGPPYVVLACEPPTCSQPRTEGGRRASGSNELGHRSRETCRCRRACTKADATTDLACPERERIATTVALRRTMRRRNATAAYRGHQSAFPARRCRGKMRGAANTRVNRAASRAPSLSNTGQSRRRRHRTCTETGPCSPVTLVSDSGEPTSPSRTFTPHAPVIRRIVSVLKEPDEHPRPLRRLVDVEVSAHRHGRQGHRRVARSLPGSRPGDLLLGYAAVLRRAMPVNPRTVAAMRRFHLDLTAIAKPGARSAP